MRGKGVANGSYFVLNNGAKIPAIGLGTWQYGGDICVEAVSAALEVGYRHIDCAHLYENEAEVGKALADAFSGGLKREDVFLTSKLYFATNSHKRIVNSVRVSLRNLGVSYLDLYLVHWSESSAFGDATDPPCNSGSDYRQFLQRLKPTWMAMEELVEMGLVRAIGVGNFSVQQIGELLQFARIVPAVNQVELHPFWRQDELVKFCQENDIHVSAHTPLGVPATSGGMSTMGLSLSDSGSEDEPGTPRITFRRSRSVHGPMLKLSVVTDIAEHHRKTPEQIVGHGLQTTHLNFHLDRPAILNKLPTRERLCKFAIIQDSSCVLCCSQQAETATYLFFECPNSNYIWRLCRLKLGIANARIWNIYEEALLLQQKYKAKNNLFTLARLVLAGQYDTYGKKETGETSNTKNSTKL